MDINPIKFHKSIVCQIRLDMFRPVVDIKECPSISSAFSNSIERPGVIKGLSCEKHPCCWRTADQIFEIRPFLYILCSEKDPVSMLQDFSHKKAIAQMP